jgi:hypothetical protein
MDRTDKKDAVSKDVKAIVVQWHFEETRINLNKNDVLCHEVGHKT